VLKIALLVLIAISVPVFAFAEPMIELSSTQTQINSLDTVLVVGKVTGVATFKPVTLTVTSPDGVVVYSPNLTVNTDGTFRWLIQPTLPSFQIGVYTVTASHEEIGNVAKIQFTVIGSNPIPKSPVVKSPESNMVDNTPKSNLADKIPNPITLSTKFENGGNKVTLIGSTTSSVTDITYRITSPNGNLISVGQITPDADGGFSTEIVTGGPQWKENGMYTITANQGLSSEHKQTIQIEIDNGVVVPEFGSIAVMILAVAIISIIAVSSKSRLVIPRY